MISLGNRLLAPLTLYTVESKNFIHCACLYLLKAPNCALPAGSSQ